MSEGNKSNRQATCRLIFLEERQPPDEKLPDPASSVVWTADAAKSKNSGMITMLFLSSMISKLGNDLPVMMKTHAYRLLEKFDLLASSLLSMVLT